MGQGYPILYPAIRRMGPKILWQRKNAVSVARRAGVLQGAGGGLLLGRVLGTFSQTNDPSGYVLSYSAGDSPFPDGTSSMTTRADLTGLSHVRLLATVSAGGGPGVTLTVTGAGEDVAVGLNWIDGEDDLVVGTWHPVTADGAVDLEWTVSATTGGTATLGLVQLQGR